MRVEPKGAMGEAVAYQTTCFFCWKPKSHLELKTVLIGGDECEVEEVEGCAPCLTKRRERAELEEYLADPFNASYEAARAALAKARGEG